MRSLGQEPSEADLLELINGIDKDGDNSISFEEFVVVLVFVETHP